jgi:cyclopropane fatty-acyl-phospholipid synthase-like methyltransferase
LRSAGSLRTSGRRRWEQKWDRGQAFPWQVTDVAPELDRSVASGWLPAGVTVLDLGCGDGVNAAWLARRGYVVHGVDFAATAIAHARERFAELPGLSFDVVDVSLPGALSGRTFGALVDRGCLSNINPRLWAAYGVNVATWAEPGSPFLLSMVGRDQPMERRHAVARLLEGTFEIEETATTDDMVSCGGITRAGIVVRMRRRAESVESD